MEGQDTRREIDGFRTRFKDVLAGIGSVMEQEGKVVVVTKPVVYRDERSERVAIHGKGMGLVAHGESEERAWQAFKELFCAAIALYRARGQLEQELNDAGVEWNWIDQYPGDYEDVSSLASEGSRVQAPRPACHNGNPQEPPSAKNRVRAMAA